MAKQRRSIPDVITEPKTFKAGGCHSWIVINKGNTNVTIGGTHVLEPGESFSSPEENPDVLDHTEFEVLFDAQNNPKLKAPDTGSLPVSDTYLFGVDPVPRKNNKMVIWRSYIS